MDYIPTLLYYIAIYMGYIIWQNDVMCLCLDVDSAAMWSSLFCRWG